MPPKVKITRDDIIKASIELVRKNGEDAVNARSLAAAMNCSTQPIFSNFDSMEELDKSVKLAAYEIYIDFLNKERMYGKYPPYKSFGMAYIRFAKEESELFKLLFMCDRKGEELVSTVDFDESVEMIMRANRCSKETAKLMHLEIWACAHGIATMLATSFCHLEWNFISEMLSDVYLGVRARHLNEIEIY